jgi:hypothetical protein
MQSVYVCSMGHSKVKRTFYIDGDLSRLLDQVANAQDAHTSRLVNRLLKEGLEQRIAFGKQIQALQSSAAGTASLAIIAMLPALLA